MRRLLVSIVVTVLMAGLVSGKVFAEGVPGWLQKDFAELTDMFEGRWDNDRHVFFAEAAGIDLHTVAPRQHIEISRLSSPEEASEETMTEFLAVRTVEGAAPARLIHRFSIDAQHQTIRQSVFVPDEDGNAAAFDCYFDWRRDGAQFRAKASGGDCDVMFPRPVNSGPLEVTMTLSPTEFWVTSARGDLEVEARMRRVRPFECWTAILRGAEHGDSGEGMSDWDFRRGIKLHDQGGVAELITDEETPQKIRLRLRDVDWTYGTNRPSLTLYVMEGDSDRAVSYAWGEAGAERIGLNLRWLQVSCTHMPAK